MIYLTPLCCPVPGSGRQKMSVQCSRKEADAPSASPARRAQH